MKDIDLPLKQTVSVTIDLQAEYDESDLIEEDGRYFRNIGGVGAEQFSELAKARENGGKVLFATTSIEADIDDIISVYFMGNSHEVSSQKNMFDQELLKSSVLSFKAKKELLKKIINSTELLKGKKKDNLENQLTKIMNMRNAFAHGKISHDTMKGCLIEFYSGRNRTTYLNDKYWDKLTNTFKEASELLTKASEQQHFILSPPQQYPPYDRS